LLRSNVKFVPSQLEDWSSDLFFFDDESRIISRSLEAEAHPIKNESGEQFSTTTFRSLRLKLPLGSLRVYGRRIQVFHGGICARPTQIARIIVKDIGEAIVCH